MPLNLNYPTRDNVTVELELLQLRKVADARQGHHRGSEGPGDLLELRCCSFVCEADAGDVRAVNNKEVELSELTIVEVEATSDARLLQENEAAQAW
uniref:Uncharacterized protein n=1 Tax=Oryza punctata TaxID=4537 RepID=A0A0E0MHR3_ORYPU